jgi:hypothetical protein
VPDGRKDLERDCDITDGAVGCSTWFELGDFNYRRVGNRTKISNRWP